LMQKKRRVPLVQLKRAYGCVETRKGIQKEKGAGRVDKKGPRRETSERHGGLEVQKAKTHLLMLIVGKNLTFLQAEEDAPGKGRECGGLFRKRTTTTQPP